MNLNDTIKGGFAFNDDFFDSVKAPKYKVETVDATLSGYGIFPSLDNMRIQFVGDSKWYSFSEKGITIESVINGSRGSDKWEVALYVKLPPSLPYVTRVLGPLIPQRLQDSVTAWDTMGMEGNMHQIEFFQGYNSATPEQYVQVQYQSVTSHPEGGESHPTNIRFGLVFENAPTLPDGVFMEDQILYNVDYKHILVTSLKNDDIVESLKNQCWPDNVDFSLLYRPAGIYNVAQKSKYILFRVL